MLTTSAGAQDGKKTVGWGWHRFHAVTLRRFHFLIVKIYHSTTKSGFFCGKLCKYKVIQPTWLDWKQKSSFHQRKLLWERQGFFSALKTTSLTLCFINPLLDGVCLRRSCFDCNLWFWLSFFQAVIFSSTLCGFSLTRLSSSLNSRAFQILAPPSLPPIKSRI